MNVPPVNEQPPAPQKKRPNTTLIVVFALIGVCTLCCLGSVGLGGTFLISEQKKADNLRPLALEFQAAFLKGDKTEMDKLADPRFKTDVSKEDMDQLLRQIHDYCGELTDPVYQSWNESTNNGEAKMTITFKMTGTKRDAKTTVTFFKSSGKYLPGSFSFNSIGKDKTQKADKKSMSI